MAIDWLSAGSACKRQQQEMMEHQLLYIAELRQPDCHICVTFRRLGLIGSK